ncbi:SDR family oxidoreductase [Rhodobacteraceae bacterium NNCM2]|nr:SDR family oxidoreductase [Coraliihabitans acroporae]
MKQTILVTGASQGIGLSVSERFAEAGWNVVMAARNADRIGAESARLGVTGVPTDVSLPDSVETLFAEIAKQHGRLDAVFNNAGMGTPPLDPGELDFALWRQVVSVNLDGSFLIASHAFRMMKEQDPQGGRIINNGSISAHAPRPGSVAYTSTKHAITGLTKSIALDGRRYNIRASQLDIGNAETPMTERMKEGVPQPNGTMQIEPVMDVRLVANAVYNMATLPLEATTLFQTLMAADMPFVGRG